MDLSKGRNRERLVPVLVLVLLKSVVCLFCVLLSLLSASDLQIGDVGKATGSLDTRNSASGRPGSLFQGGDRGRTAAEIPRRYLMGPGSYPPRCTARCGRCTPCRPVHVPVPPGTRVTTEYYPEAWRCKCGNRLYMP